MRLVADLVRGKEVFRALGILKFNNKEAAARLEKLVRSAVANWEQKNERKAEEGELYISTIYVNCAPMLKRLRTAPRARLPHPQAREPRDSDSRPNRQQRQQSKLHRGIIWDKKLIL